MGEIQQLKFVGRGDEIKRLNAFVFDETAGGILLVRGEPGMGKSRLVKEYFAQLRPAPRRKLGKIYFEIARDWPPETYFRELMGRVQKGIPARAKGKIKDRWIDLAGVFSSRLEKGLQFLFSKDNTAPAQDRFLSLLIQAADKLDHKSRLVVILDPNRELHPESLPIFNRFVSHVPECVKFIIPQRGNDVLISDPVFVSHEDIVQVLELGEIAGDDIDHLYKQAMPRVVLENEVIYSQVKRLYGGWPLMVNGVGIWLKRQKDVGKALENPPVDIEGVHSKVFEPLETPEYERQRSAVYRMSILSGAQDKSFLAHYLKLKAGKVGEFLTGKFLKDFMEIVKEADARKYELRHETLKEFVQRYMKDKDVDIGELHKEAAAAFYKRMEKNRNDAEALTEYTYHLKESADRRAFIEGLDRVKDDKDRIGLYAQLKEELTEALTYEEINEDLKRKGWFLNDLGLVNQKMGKLHEALDCHKKAEAVFRKVDDEAGQAGQYGNIGNVLFKQGDVEGALENHRKALEISERLGLHCISADQYGNIGNVLFKQGDFEGALENHGKALQIDEKMGNPLGLAQEYGNIGLVLGEKGDLEGALENFTKAKKTFENIGEPSAAASVYGNMGLVYFKRGDLNGALENHKKDLEISQRIGQPEGIARAYGNIGIVLREEGDLEGALENHKEALEISEEIGWPEGMANNYGNIGLVLADQGDLEGALENYEKALKIYRELRQPAGEAHTYINIANIHSQKDDYKAAALLQLQALLIYSQIGMKRELEIAERNLVISVRKLKEQGKFEEFLREAKEKFGEEVEDLLRGL